MRGAVLQRLELADQLAELLALLEIVDGHVRRAGGDADQLGRGAGAAGVRARATAAPSRRRPRRRPRRHRAATLSKVSRAAFELSASATFSTSRPPAPFSTANRVMPSVSPGEPAVRAATTIMSADAPWTTNCLAPLSTKPLPCALGLAARSLRGVALALVDRERERPLRRRGCRDTSARHAPCPRSRAHAATAVVRNGEGVRLRPISSSTSAGLDRAEAEPAVALGDADAGQAELAELLPQAVPKPSLQPVSRQWRSCLAMPPSSARKLAAVSCSIFWSSVSKRHRQAPGRPQDVLGDDVELDLARAALDRIALGAQPVARRPCRSSTARCPIRARPSRRRPSPARGGAC